MSAHTPTPWTDFILATPLAEIPAYVAECISRSGGDDFYFISAPHEDGGSVDVCHVGNGPRGAANAAHIVRCVNAWDNAESLRLRLIELNPAANDVHDELVAALHFCIQCDGLECLGDHPNVLAAARAALAKAGAA